MMRISACHFVAGVVVDENGIVVLAAPIVRYMTGWTAGRVMGYCASKNWRVEWLSSQ